MGTGRVTTALFLILALFGCGDSSDTGETVTGGTTVTTTTGFVTTVEPPSSVVLTSLTKTDPDTSAFDEYIKGLYLLVQYQPATDAEIASWLSLYQSGTSIPSIALQFLQSTNHLNQQVTNYFSMFLNRMPTPTESSAWGQAIYYKGAASVMAAILSGPEFYTNAGSQSSTWASALYQSLLNRQPTSGETASVVSQIASGTAMFNIALVLVNSNEFVTQHYIPGLYAYYLNRAPDTASLTSFAKSLSNNSIAFINVELDIISSQEFANDCVALDP
jgi:hypothetical protein